MANSNASAAPAEKKGFLSIINWWVFLPASSIFVILIIFGFASPEGLAAGANAFFNFFINNFTWFLLLGCFLLVVFTLYVGCSKIGNIRLGGKNAKPDMSFFSWFCISLTACIGVGIVFYGVNEPMTFFTSPPAFLNLEPQSAEAVEAWGYILLHWLLTPYGIFTAAGVVCSFMCWNGKRKYKVSSSLYPILGDRVDGRVGDLIDSFCLFILIGSLTTSVGVCAMQIASGLGYISGQNLETPLVYSIIIIAIVVFFVAAACSGLHKGMKYISQINVYIFFALLLMVFILGNTRFQLNNTVQGLGYYLDKFIWQSFYTEQALQTGWVGGWTTFYFTWYVAPAPIFGLFLIKMAKGRTIRQFVIVNLLCPCIFVLLWFGCFGGEAMSLSLAGDTSIINDMATYGPQVSLFALGNCLPGKWLFYILGILACIFSFATMGEAQTLTLADSCTKIGAAQSSPRSLRIFWGVILGGMGLVVLLSGGYSALQSICITCGTPALVLMLVQCCAFLKSMRHPEQYDLTLDDPEEIPAITK